MRKIILLTLIVLFSCTVCALTQMDCTNPDHDCSGLVSYWKMDEASWGAVGDSVGSNDGTPQNGANTVAGGKENRGGAFDGSDDYVNVPDSSSLDITDAITVTLWAKVDSNTGVILQKGEYCFTGNNDPQSPYSMCLYPASNRLYIEVGSGATGTSGRSGASHDISSIIGDGQYHFYALTYDYSTGNVGTWLDSTKKSNTWNKQIGTNNNPLTIGRGTVWDSGWNSKYLDGNIDEVHIWNRALSDAEIDSMYTLGYLPLGGEEQPIPEFSGFGLVFILLFVGVFMYLRR